MDNSIPEKAVYSGYGPLWYEDIGNQVIFFIFSSAFLNNTAYIGNYILKGCLRCRDRSCKLRMKRNPDDPEDDTPNTRKKIQGDLEALYMGKEF